MIRQIKDFQKNFGKYGEGETDILGFVPFQNLRMLKTSIANGRWGMIFFSTDQELNISEGIRILPSEKSENWPVYQLNHLNCAFLHSPNIPSFIVYNHYYLLKKYRSNNIKYKNNWNEYYDVILPVYKYFKGIDNLDELKKEIFDEANWPEKNLPKLPDEDYVKFMIAQSKDKKGAKYLFELIKKVNENENYLPEIPPKELGIWENRVWNVTGMRAYTKAFEMPYEKIEPLLFGCFIQPHGYDAEWISTNIEPNESSPSDNMVWKLVNTKMTTAKEKHLSDIIKAPEYQAALAILEKGQGGYTGLEHIEAAAILDSEMNEPMRAWNCLLSAGYWAGMNQPELQETIMEAAIYLCKKHKWTEAADAVQYNLDIYKSA